MPVLDFLQQGGVGTAGNTRQLGARSPAVRSEASEGDMARLRLSPKMHFGTKQTFRVSDGPLARAILAGGRPNQRPRKREMMSPGSGRRWASGGFSPGCRREVKVSRTEAGADLRVLGSRFPVSGIPCVPYVSL